MKELMVVDNIYKEYGSNENKIMALDGVSLTIHEGEFLGIMGPSGSGKSTLLNMIATIDRPSKGYVLVNNQRVFAMADVDITRFRRENMGLIYQDCKLLDSLTIKDNIISPLLLAGKSEKECESKLIKIASRMGIQEILDKYPTECSGGQKQRAAACRALITNPKMIVGDEPTGALDTKNSVELLNILHNLNKEDGIAIVMVTHSPMIASYCDKLLIIKDGKIDKVMERNNKLQLDFYQDILEETEQDINNFLE